MIEKALVKRQLAATDTVTRQLLANADVEEVEDQRLNAMILRLRTFVWQDPSLSHTRSWKVVENASYESWRHHLIAGLPWGSWRRRFLGYFWDIDPEYGGKQVTHTIEVDVPAVLPEIQHQFPRSFGRVVFPINITEWGAAEPTQITSGEPEPPGGYWIEDR